MVVLSLTTALVVIGRREVLGGWMMAWLILLAVYVTLYSLVQFYGSGDHQLAVDRLRNAFTRRSPLRKR